MKRMLFTLIVGTMLATMLTAGQRKRESTQQDKHHLVV